MFYENLIISYFGEVQDKMDKSTDGKAIVYVTPYIYPSSLVYGSYSQRQLNPKRNPFTVKAIKMWWENDISTNNEFGNKIHISGNFDVAHLFFNDYHLTKDRRIEVISSQHIVVKIEPEFFNMCHRYNGRGFRFVSIGNLIGSTNSVSFYTNPRKAKVNTVWRTFYALSKFYYILNRKLSSIISAQKKSQNALPDKFSFADGNFESTYSKKDKARLIKLLVKGKRIYRETSKDFILQSKNAHKKNDADSMIAATDLFNHERFCSYYELINQYRSSLSEHSRDQFFNNFFKESSSTWNQDKLNKL